MLDLPREAIRRWLVDLFANAVKRLNNREDRLQAIKWLGQSREIVGSDLNLPEKVGRLRALIDSRTVVKFVAARVTESVQNYRKSNLPLAVKIALPATLAALPFVGGQAAGIAAFGGAIGVPVLLLPRHCRNHCNHRSGRKRSQCPARGRRDHRSHHR